MKIDNLIRTNILNLSPYSSARDEFTGSEAIFLDANENPFGTLNRYPDPHQKQLKNRLSQLKNINSDRIFIGNGSDEVIDLALRIFCTPGRDKIIICPPTYGMYQVSAATNDIEVIKIPLTHDFQLDTQRILEAEAKMLFLCSPNNPTGNSLNDLEYIISNFNGIVFLDEAYIDFSPHNSFINLLGKYDNLIVSQTLSKAWGHAAIRVGMAFSSPYIIHYFNKIKPPYNVSELNQKAALVALDNIDDFYKNCQTIKDQKEQLITELSVLNIVKKIYPSDANFLLLEMKDATSTYNYLVENKIIARLRHSVVPNTLRITIGTLEENQILIQQLQNISQ